MNREYNNALNELQFSSEAKERMAKKLVAMQEESTDNTPKQQPTVLATRGGKRRLRYVAAVAAAVVVALGVGGGAYASGALRSVSNVFDDVFGGSPAQTEVIDKVGRPVGASASSNGVTITADAIIGDKDNCVLVFSIRKDDGTAFEGLKPLENGILPLGFEAPSSTSIDGVLSGGGGSYFYDADPSDNAIQYVERTSVDTLGNNGIIGRAARVELRNLSVRGDGEARTLVEGVWKLKFAINYEDTSVSLGAGQSFEMNGMQATVDEMSISPIAITVRYTVDGVMQWEDQADGQMSDHNSAEVERFAAPVLITKVDGTVIDISNGASSTERLDNGTTACREGIIFTEVMNLDDIVSITIGDTVIALP